MKLTIERALEIESAIKLCINEVTNMGVVAPVKGLDGSISYGLGKNLNRLTPALKKFRKDNELRITSYAKKDDSNNPIVKDNKFDFGDKKQEADDKYKELIKSEFDFEPYPIKRSEHTDKLPAEAQAELFDLIIIE